MEIKSEYFNSFGCVWFFDPHSVQVELNHDIFPEGQIASMKVDVLPGARYANKVTGTDAYRKFLGLKDRDMNLNNPNDFKTGLGEEGAAWYDIWGFSNKSEVLGNYYYGNYPYPDGIEKYGRYTSTEDVNGKPQTVWGVGSDKRGCIIEPQLACGELGDWHCIAPPVEVNVRVTLKMDDGKTYVFNRIYLPQVEYMQNTQQNLVDLWNNNFNVKDFKNYQQYDLETYDYNRKRCYDKIKFMFPKANISYEAWDK